MTTTVCRLHSQDDLRIEQIADQPVEPGHIRVAIARGGICGSDLHYYKHGGFGPVRVREPLILGHEIAGVIEEIGDGIDGFVVGDKVAISPSNPCHDCHYCNRADFQHCENMRFLGSARTLPHVQGGFRSNLTVKAQQCFRVGAGTSLAHAACAEPLAVCLHAANQAGDLEKKRVLVTGAGPIGALCVAVAKAEGASEIVVTDLADFTLRNAAQMGASTVVNVATSSEKMDKYKAPARHFDVVFECSAAESAIQLAIECVRPRGTIVQVGVAGSISLPINAIVGKEIVFRGTHRFHGEFEEAVGLIDQRRIDVAPMVTHVFPASEAVDAFDTALDRHSAIKVQLSF